MLGREVVAAAAARGVECVGLDARASSTSPTLPRSRAALAEHSPRRDHQLRRVDRRRRRRGARGRRRSRSTRDGAGNLARAAAPRARGSSTSRPTTSSTAPRRGRMSSPTRPRPRTAYGRTKLAGERAGARRHRPARRRAHRVAVRRPGGRNFVASMLERARGRAPRSQAFTDQVGCPTYSVHLAEKLLDLAAQRRGGIFHEAASGHCSRLRVRAGDPRAAGVDGRDRADAARDRSPRRARPGACSPPSATPSRCRRGRTASTRTSRAGGLAA